AGDAGGLEEFVEGLGEAWVFEAGGGEADGAGMGEFGFIGELIYFFFDGGDGEGGGGAGEGDDEGIEAGHGFAELAHAAVIPAFVPCGGVEGFGEERGGGGFAHEAEEDGGVEALRCFGGLRVEELEEDGAGLIRVGEDDGGVHDGAEVAVGGIGNCGGGEGEGIFVGGDIGGENFEIGELALE